MPGTAVADLTLHRLRAMSSRAVPAPLAHLPNALTLGRLAVIPVFVALMVEAGDAHSWPAGILFGAAGVTDQIDGFLARRWHVESRFGKIADPVADRVMIDAAVILLVAYGRLPWAALAVVAARDLLLLVGWRILSPRGVDIDVNVIGKAATWILYAAIGFRIVTHDATSWPLWLFWIGLGGALLAALFYVRAAGKELRG
jgi:cardiolipin synthase (CMP-forming)